MLPDDGNMEVAEMSVVLGVLVLVGVLSIVASVVLAAIAAVVEVLPPLRSQDADDHGAGTPAGATVRPRRWLADGDARKARTRFSH